MNRPSPNTGQPIKKKVWKMADLRAVSNASLIENLAKFITLAKVILLMIADTPQTNIELIAPSKYEIL